MQTIDRETRSTNYSFIIAREDPNVVNVNLESIEHHIKFKDPESHKSKLLEMIQKRTHG